MLLLAVILASISLTFGFPHSPLDPKIVGGEPVSIKQYPHQVSLQYYGSHVCGGSILNSNTILTAAHCVDGWDLGGFTVRAGSTYHEEGGQLVKVSDITVHPDFVPSTYDYDIAILITSRIDIDNISTKSIALTQEEIPAGGTAEVSGWGYLSDGGIKPDDLYAVRVLLITRNKCISKYNGHITERMICAGYDNGGKDACQGDSGGPLIYHGKQIGVVSWGEGCGDGDHPGVYANLANEGIKKFLNMNH